MSTLNLSLGVAFVSGALSVVVGAILPELQPIEVHALTYSDGIIHQERTITADGDIFFASWKAQILDADTMGVVCEGQGTWNYPVGYKVADIPLAEWVGQDSCTPDSLPAGEYIPRAVWFWGSDQSTQTGEVFVIE